MIRLMRKTAQKGIIDPKIIIGGIVVLVVIFILATGKFNFSASVGDKPSSKTESQTEQVRPEESQPEQTQSPSVPKSYKSDQYSFSLEYPGEWSHKEAQGQYVAAFFSPLESSSDTYREFLGVKAISIASIPSSPLELATDLWEKQTVAESKDDDFKVVERKSSTISGKEASELVYTVNIEGKAAKGFVKITIANDNIYIFQYFAETDKYEQFLSDIETIISSISL
ncbi:hypothetical protein HYU93_03165 [Candidatus Daviesbacteria bacterium]|nr:hypothetical protein [Candidatus Daviesbacteria bacterium]